LSDLFPFQHEGARWLAKRNFAMLGDQPRVGKTPQALVGAILAGASRIAITCPAIAIGVWERAIEQWGLGMFEAEIRSYDAASDKGLPWGCDTYIFDEAHRLGNIGSQRTQNLLGHKSPARNAARVWALSGSFAPNHAGELFPWMRFAGLYQGGYFDFLGTFTRFKMEKVGPRTKVPKVYGNNPRALGELRRRLAPVFLRRTRRQVYPDQALPIWSDILLAPNVADSRFQVDKSLILVDALPKEEGEHLATARRLAGEAKAGPLGDYIARELATSGEKIAVFGWHTSVLDVLHEKLAPFGLVRIDGATPAKKRTAAVEAFRMGDNVRVVLGQTIAAGEAVDLSAARRLILAEMAWSEGANAQVTARMGGPNQQGQTFIQTATLKGSVDEAVNAVLARKTRALEEIYGDIA